jgi:hypothetical protein
MMLLCTIFGAKEVDMKHIVIVVLFVLGFCFSISADPRASITDIGGATVDTIAGGIIGEAAGKVGGFAFGVFDIIILAASGKTFGTHLIENAFNPNTKKMMNYINRNGGWYGISSKAAIALLDGSWDYSPKVGKGRACFER